ncbi:MAG: ParB/RepB/Spo0J family partition protein [Clostridia bacterium]|nr:ParB/RepB/Spo0J family partition protein [Clostridia bacterium]
MKNSSAASEKVVNNVVEIPIDKISLNPYQPRKNFDSDAIAELAKSIKQYGVIQPITVRKNFIGGYELISGERRLKASRLVNFTHMPCIVIDVTENDSAVIALLENLQRADLSYWEEAEAMHHLICDHKYTQEEVAEKLGKSQSAVANRLRILKLPESVREILREKNLTERHARALLKVHDEHTQLKILKQVCENEYNVAKTEELVEKAIEKVELERTKESGKMMGVVHLRMFINTINKAVDVVQKAGVMVETSKKENKNFIEYLIKIPCDKDKLKIMQIE